jgi:DNA mismatch endonuclease Vsr
MKYKIVIIKGVKEKLIKVDGIWVYKDHFCEHCGERITYNESHIKNGVPQYIQWHHYTNNFERRNVILSEPTIIENGIKVYEKYFCGCEDEDGNNCGLRIPYPIDSVGINNHKRRGIPKVIQGHVSKEMKEKNRIRNSGIYNPNYGKPRSKETRDKISKSEIGKILSNEQIQKQRKFMQNWFLENPEHLKKMCEAQTYVSKPELIMRNYTIKKLDKLNIKYHLNLCKIKGIPDITIETEDGHPIALFEDGCFIHGCKCIDWSKVKYDIFLWMIEQKEHDRNINEDLTKQGYRVVRIWQHDIDNGNYKKIINQLIAEIKSL